MHLAGVLLLVCCSWCPAGDAALSHGAGRTGRGAGSAASVWGSGVGGQRSVTEESRTELVLVAYGDGCYGPVVEFEGRPPVDHHAGVPAPRANGHPNEDTEPLHTLTRTQNGYTLNADTHRTITH